MSRGLGWPGSSFGLGVESRVVWAGQVRRLGSAWRGSSLGLVWGGAACRSGRARYVALGGCGPDRLVAWVESGRLGLDRRAGREGHGAGSRAGAVWLGRVRFVARERLARARYGQARRVGGAGSGRYVALVWGGRVRRVGRVRSGSSSRKGADCRVGEVERGWVRLVALVWSGRVRRAVGGWFGLVATVRRGQDCRVGAVRFGSSRGPGLGWDVALERCGPGCHTGRVGQVCRAGVDWRGTS
jgi:hypothetical protein